MANGYQGGGQPPLRRGWLEGWSKTPVYRGASCPGNGAGSHPGHPGQPRSSTRALLRTARPAYRYPQGECPVVVQAIPEGVTTVQAVATSAEADTLAKQGQIAIVFPRAHSV
jgi:hypothetical protein